MEVEDDLFFADLSKQISLLIMDDDEDEDPVARCPSVSLQAFSRAVHPANAPSTFMYEQPCRRESKGTGVFIPQSTQPRRKHRQQGRYNNTSFSSKSPRQLQPAALDHSNSRMQVSQVSYSKK